ncbi:DUF1801 domain-containing protein [Autumnicola psychrophila]|uniref:DUF1801 domain-containing protein n=1 Tax=Autumnicola psychrophila TaxID=3075592 RepID=A0ABU3DTS1_9FLAO|nr:DUF1801 domain-containing protein [Zunongwangia sp. F225]MDT0687112.1 DUF1801 domain-containing protein [Zunongwangia sp. F225]
MKWGAPVYTLEGKNVIGLAAFKNHCAMWFFNGASLKEIRLYWKMLRKEKPKHYGK